MQMQENVYTLLPLFCTSPSLSFWFCDPPWPGSLGMVQWAVCDVTVVVFKVLYLLSLYTGFLLCRFPVNMQDPIWKHFGYVQLWPLRPACSQNPPSWIRFSSVLPKKAEIQSGWPGQVLSKRVGVQKQAGVQESSGPSSGRMRPARYRLPTFRLGCILPQMARIKLYKASPDPIWFWLTA